jgi:outer membrane protein TolC
MHAWPSFPGTMRRPGRSPVRALGVGTLAGGLMVLAACSLGPRYQKPDIAPPEHWVTPADPGAPEWPTSEWWRGFNSSDLDAFIAAAQRANDDLRAAVARVSEADAERRIARAPLLPTLGIAAQATRARAPQPGSGNAGFATGNDFNPLLTASYQLDFFGKSRAQLAAATATANASRYDRSTIELTVMAGVASSYFQTLELRDRLAIADSNLANASQVLRGLELEERAGIATALDVAQQQTVVATVNASIPPLREQLRQAHPPRPSTSRAEGSMP